MIFIFCLVLFCVLVAFGRTPEDSQSSVDGLLYVHESPTEKQDNLVEEHPEEFLADEEPELDEESEEFDVDPRKDAAEILKRINRR